MTEQQHRLSYNVSSCCLKQQENGIQGLPGRRKSIAERPVTSHTPTFCAFQADATGKPAAPLRQRSLPP